MSSRHRGRELAVQLVYQLDLDLKAWGEDKVVERFWKEQARSTEDNKDFFKYLVGGVAANLPLVDKKLESALKNWRMDRIEKVDLAILRVAIFEFYFGEPRYQVDAPVVINEAVEIAKKFGAANSAAFVNGVLDGIIKKKTA
jgi:N utilization substance protein B